MGLERFHFTYMYHRLKRLGDKVVKQLSNQLAVASDITSKLDKKLTSESLKPNDLVDIKSYKERIDSMEDEIKSLSTDKLDVTPHAKDMFSLLYQTDEIIMSSLKKAEIEFDTALKQRDTEANTFELDIKHWSSEENIEYLVEEVIRRLFGQSSLVEEQEYMTKHDTQAFVQKTLCDYIGEIFLTEIMRDQPTTNIYPSVVNSLQVRDTAAHPAKIRKLQPNKLKEKLKRLKKDSEDVLSSLQEKLNSDSLIKTYDHLGHIERILS